MREATPSKIFISVCKALVLFVVLVALLLVVKDLLS
jgi:hypothetical protein